MGLGFGDSGIAWTHSPFLLAALANCRQCHEPMVHNEIVCDVRINIRTFSSNFMALVMRTTCHNLRLLQCRRLMFETCNHPELSYNMPFLSLPNELLMDIAELLEQQEQVYAMVRSCRRLYYLLRRYLLRYNIRYEKGSALLWAAKNDRRNLVRRLLRLGVNVDNRGSPQHHGTSLHYAARAGHLGMVQLLLKKGADPDACGVKQYKPLFAASLGRHEEISILLFSKLSEPNSQIAGENGYMPLHAACLTTMPKAARVFLESGANVNARTSKGNTPLHLALRSRAPDQSKNNTGIRAPELVTLLLEFGARKDNTAYNLAALHPDAQVRDMFLVKKGLPSRKKTSFIDIGRSWSVERSFDTGRVSLTAVISRPRDQHSIDIRGTEDPANVVQDLLDNKIFPGLDTSRPLQHQPKFSAVWNARKVKEMTKPMPMDESSRGRITAPSLQAEPFPKLIGRRSLHPLQSAAQLSWESSRNRISALLEESRVQLRKAMTKHQCRKVHES